MNTFTNNTVRTLGSAFAALILLALPLAAVHAADLGTGWDTTGYTDYSSPSYDYSSPSYSGWDTTGYTDYSTPSYSGWDTTGYTDYTSPSYTGYSSYTPSYSSYMPSSFYSTFPTQSQSQSQSQSSTNVNTNVNTNTCSATNSCNTTTQINAPTTVTTNTTGGGGYSYPVYTPVYQPVYQPPVYQPVYTPPVYQQPIAYNQPAPYVSLSAVPYTGLDLGPVGTALYWGFLILWCLGAAYLIVVKRVQNKLVGALNGFLFGHTSHAPVAHVAPAAAHAPAIKAVPAKTIFSGIDPFIASQISRATA